MNEIKSVVKTMQSKTNLDFRSDTANLKLKTTPSTMYKNKETTKKKNNRDNFEVKTLTQSVNV